MEKELKLLYQIHNEGFQSQRKLSEGTNLSVGLVNGLLKKLCGSGLLAREENEYRLTAQGEAVLETEWRKRQKRKLNVHPGGSVRQAVILAAGANPAFPVPVGMLSLDGIPLIEHILRELSDPGITKIVVVTGSQKELFAEYLRGRGVILTENDRYLWTGTMASLQTAAEHLTEDFLLVESNQILERAAFADVLRAEAANALLLVNPSGSSDEAYVELDDEGNVFRISKDIRQMNRIDGELTGVCKISQKLFKKMLHYYQANENPLLNYEYVIENIGRIYKIPVVRADSLKWTVIETAAHYRQAQERIYPAIRKKNRLYRENQAKEIFLACMGAADEEVLDFHVCGGMTNTNFYVKTSAGEYVLRIAGAGTAVMIDRGSEEKNAALGAALGVNVPTLYFDAARGIKITEYIRGAETLNAKTAQWEANIRKTTALLRRLHTSQIPMENEFSVRTEYEKYKKQIPDGDFYPGFWEMDAFFYHLLDRLEVLGKVLVPCHNDLVPENLIKDKDGRMYLIDWEYSGRNDAMWDLAAHLLECEFSPQAEELFLSEYFGGEILADSREKLLLFKICQDILWSVWTRVKERGGEDFGSYGRDRLARAAEKKEAYEREYE